jgi:UDP-N-acetylmuramoylalanine-D-glutamate ligase
MERLAAMIRPTVGVLTNIGSAHDEGFVSIEQKRSEKGRLFETAAVVIGPEPWTGLLAKHISWGQEEGASLHIDSVRSGTPNDRVGNIPRCARRNTGSVHRRSIGSKCAYLRLRACLPGL